MYRNSPAATAMTRTVRKNASSGSEKTASNVPVTKRQHPARNAETVIVTSMRKKGMGRSPYPLSAASAASGTLGFPEDGKAQGDQTGAQEHQQHGICRHDVPNVTDQVGQRRGVTKDGSNSGGRSLLKSTLLSKKMYGCGERSRTSISSFRAWPATVTAPRYVTRCGASGVGDPRRSVRLMCYDCASNR